MQNLIINLQFGLGNRLRALASALLIAKISGWHLKVVWESDLHCGAEFNDLFETDFDLVDPLGDDEMSECEVYNYMDNDKRRSKKLTIDLESKRDIYIISAFSLDYPGRDIEKENVLLRTLKFSEKVERIVNNYNVSDTIGVHIRMGGGKNHSTDRWDSDEFWDQEAKKLMYHWRDKSHYSAFINEMDQLLSDDPELRFFLATDMRSTYNILADRYQDRIIYVERNCFDRSKQQQIYALADMVLLSKSKWIIGSYWSTFTEIAQRLGNKKVRLSGIDF